MPTAAVACATAHLRAVLLGLLLGIAGPTLAATDAERIAPAMQSHPHHGAGHVSVSNAWARATAPGIGVGAAYFAITNLGHQADELISLKSPAASAVQLHRTTVDHGLSRMHPAGPLVIPPGQTLRVEPGQLHVMLTGLAHPLLAGTRVPLVLTFRDAGPITVQLLVQPAAYVSHDGHEGH